MRGDGPHSKATFNPGQILDGRYQIIEVLGRGGMGTVYKVEQVFLGSPLALKIISDTALSDVNIRRFQSEARVTSALKHPNIVSMHDFGILENHYPFLAMEFVQGETLDTVITRGSLKQEDILNIFLQVCAGLAHAHNRGIVHRDIKPSNIMILEQLPMGTDGSVKILDFGIAKLMQHEGGEIQALTKTGEIFGSPLYMSPEQCTGGIVDYRSDIYSLGCVLFETLTGAAPFAGENALATMMLHQSSPIPLLREASLGADFPSELQQVVQTMLAKEPSERYQSLDDAIEDLSALKQGQVPHRSVAIGKLKIARPPSQQYLMLDRTKFFSILFANAVACCLLSAVVTHIALQQRSNSSTDSITNQPTNTRITGLETAPTNKTGAQATGGQTTSSTTSAHTVDTTIPSSTIEREASKEPPTYSPFAPEDAESIKNQIEDKKAAIKIQYDITDANMAAFDGYTKAQCIDITNVFITDKGLNYLRHSNVLEVILRGCAIRTVNSFLNFPNLQYVNLKETQIDDKAIPIFLSMKNLAYLNISKTAVTENAASQLASSDSLRKLWLPRNYTPDFLAEFKKKIPQCEINDKRCYLDELAHIKSPAHPTEAELEQKLALAEKLYSSRNIMGLEKMLLAQFKVKDGKLGEAEALINSSLQMLAKAKTSNYLATALTVRAEIEFREKHFAKYDADTTRAAKVAIDTMRHYYPETEQLLFTCSNNTPDNKYLDHSISIAEKGLQFAEEFSELKSNWYEPFLTRITWFCFLNKQFDRAKPFLEKQVKWCGSHYGEFSVELANALVLTGRCSDSQYEKLRVFNKAVAIIEQNQFPEKLNALGNCCDACGELINLLDKQNKLPEAIKYARIGFIAAKKIPKDEFKRARYFAQILVSHLKRNGRDLIEAKSLAKEYQLPYDSLN